MKNKLALIGVLILFVGIITSINGFSQNIFLNVLGGGFMTGVSIGIFIFIREASTKK